jgi:hypothetical protein
LVAAHPSCRSPMPSNCPCWTAASCLLVGVRKQGMCT